MDTNRLFPTYPDAANAAEHHARTAAITVAVLAIAIGGLIASLWLASFFLYASLRVNPLHAGLWGWPDALLAWHDGQWNGGRRLVGAALLGTLVAVGGPSMGLYSLVTSTGRRRLYGSARFACESEIRAAGLL
ncbi:hypothetical protein ACMX25_21760 [Caballeronia sp. 15715]|uniref:hypothetical protein n=1 Tax=Caballeronia sp. 15715 TaxID=3391030 RepID=UPI0039E4C6C1